MSQVGRRRLAIAAAALIGTGMIATAGCTSVQRPGASATPARPTCPRSYAAPDPNRPRIAFDLTVAADHRHVRGHERVRFTPDLPVTEMVFRLTANSPTDPPPDAAHRSSTRVLSASADHGALPFTVTRAGADPNTQGGLLHIPFRSRVPAGTTVEASIDFTLTLGDVAPSDFPRFGRAGRFAYFGSGAPLLAWERGYGWHTEDLVGFPSETATSEAADVDLTVTAPVADTVIMSGDPAGPPRHGTTRTWHSTIATARDVSVAVGPFVVSDTEVGDVRLRVGATTAAQRDRLVPEFTRAITGLTARFGPYPFPSLSVARLPVEGGGIEYPGSILLLDSTRQVIVHETAHQWFYAMVGDSQALHPWLDEAFASYAEALVDQGSGVRPDQVALDRSGPVDASVESYGSDATSYYVHTYDKGAAALEAARAAAGPARFDAAVRCYVAANAWRIARPADLAVALRNLPAALQVLRTAGAL